MLPGIPEPSAVKRSSNPYNDSQRVAAKSNTLFYEDDTRSL